MMSTDGIIYIGIATITFIILDTYLKEIIFNSFSNLQLQLILILGLVILAASEQQKRKGGNS